MKRSEIEFGDISFINIIMLFCIGEKQGTFFLVKSSLSYIKYARWTVSLSVDSDLGRCPKNP